MTDRIDINSDMGESFGVYKLGRDAEVMDLITSANIACGWHAGDPMATNLIKYFTRAIPYPVRDAC